jgi:hypothetical protein
MLLRHATPARNVNSILKAGLLCSRSRGKMPVVWVCSPCKTWWAVIHTVERHGGRVESTVVIELDVPRSWLCRNRKGLWYCPRDVPPDRIKHVLTFHEIAASPAA